MEKTLFGFIWRYSSRQQWMLLAVTVATFPVLYLTLEIPKRIINDAISGDAFPVLSFGFEFEQVEYLLLLSGAYLAFVIISGLLKMRLNTMKGVVAERLLRRLRYQLIHRILRFPEPHMRRTSQGELIAIVTSEAEPLGGIMGDALAQPVFQAGQMLTIMTFLFIQNPWLGLAAVALIPVQAYVIPMLQRRITLLQKERVRRVRRLAERIGETVSGVEDLRANNGVPFVLADFTRHLAGLFEVRYQIYQQKFFMKFLNNFLNQLTPFFFFAIGGYLAIQGDLTVGALVAALAAYKDLSAPWRELLTYYNQTHDLSLRYKTVIADFDPAGMMDERLLEGRPEEIPALRGPVAFQGVTLRDESGGSMLSDLTFELQPASTVAIKVEDTFARRALSQLFTRGVRPSSGRIIASGRDLSELHQSVVATRIGVASGQPQLFSGIIRENVLMALRSRPNEDRPLSEVQAAARDEAVLVGNSTDAPDADWLAPELAGFRDDDEISDWILQLMEAMGTKEFLFHRMITGKFDPDAHPDLAARIIALRPKMAAALKEAGLEKVVHRFDPDVLNPGLDLAENILFAVPNRPVRQSERARDPGFRFAIAELGLEESFFELAGDLAASLVATFRGVGPDHPLYQRLSGLDTEFFDDLVEAHDAKERDGWDGLTEEHRAVFMTAFFAVTPEKLGDALPAALKAQLLELRASQAEMLRGSLSELYAPIEPMGYMRGLNVLENLVFGRLDQRFGVEGGQIEAIAATLLDEEGLRDAVTILVGYIDAGVGGVNIGPMARERISILRAAVKKPDILVLDRALASQSADERARTRERLRALLPDATMVFLEPEVRRPSSYDQYLEIVDGRLVDDASAGAPASAAAADAGGAAAQDLAKKMSVLRKVSLFDGVDRDQLRLLAYASNWVTARSGDHLFSDGEPADGAYVLVSGEAELRWPRRSEDQDPVTTIEPGRLIGDMSVIREEPRNLDMVALGDVKVLKIGAQEFRDVVNNNNELAVRLLKTVSGYLITVAERLADARQRLPQAPPMGPNPELPSRDRQGTESV